MFKIIKVTHYNKYVVKLILMMYILITKQDYVLMCIITIFPCEHVSTLRIRFHYLKKCLIFGMNSR